MSPDPVLTDISGPVLTVTLNRPDKLNCINWEMLDLLEQAVRRCEEDDHLRVMVVRGAGGRAFSTGGDLKVFKSLDEAATAKWIRKGNALFDRIERLSKATVAVIDGYAFGGGLELALACDFRLATFRASFRLPEVLHGWPPGWGALHRLKRIVGEPRAKQMILLAKPVDGKRAEEIGLVTTSVSSENLQDELAKILDILIGIDPLVMAAAKEALAKPLSATQTSFDTLAAFYGKFQRSTSPPDA